MYALTAHCFTEMKKYVFMRIKFEKYIDKLSFILAPESKL